MDLYTRIDEQLYSMVNINEDLFITTSGGQAQQTSTNFWRIQFEKEDLIDRQLQIKPNIQDVTSNCQFTLKGESCVVLPLEIQWTTHLLVVCGNVLAICTCSDHVISYDLSNYENASNYCLDFDTRIVQFQKNLPSTGIDYVIHFEHSKSRFFERIGNWFRIWYSKR